MQLLGRGDNLIRDEVVRYYAQILVGDDKRDIVAVIDNRRDKRVGHIVTHSLAVHPLHSCCPQLHIVTLLDREVFRHLVGDIE